MKLCKHPIWTVYILWFLVTTPGTKILNIPREKGWHPIGVHLNIEDCREAAHQAAREYPGRKILACRKKPGWHGKILLIGADRQDIPLQKKKWILWIHHRENWRLKGRPMSPGWYPLSTWSGLRGCADAWSRAPFPTFDKKCLIVDTFPAENIDLLRDHM